MLDQSAKFLTADILEVCPIVGVSIGVPGQPETVHVDYDPSATQEQITAAQAIVAAFDWEAVPDRVQEGRLFQQEYVVALLQNMDAYIEDCEACESNILNSQSVKDLATRQKAILLALNQIISKLNG